MFVIRRPEGKKPRLSNRLTVGHRGWWVRITKKARQHGACRAYYTKKRQIVSGSTLPYLARAEPVAGCETGTVSGSAAGAAPLRLAAPWLAPDGADLRLPSRLPLLDRMKSEMRGAISARKRDPLNTP